jgi:RNA polymerase sigma factor (sigma-70 family)
MSRPLFFLNADGRILDQIRQGDEEGLIALYNANKNAIVSYVTRNGGTHDDAEDVLQEALMVLWERVRAGRFEHTAKLSTFIYAVVKNMWARQLARKQRNIPLTPDHELTINNEESLLDQLIDEEEAQSIRDGLSKLGDPCRKLLILFYWDEMTLEAIAAEMGFANAETVKSKKYQCKEMLKKLLKAVQ